MKYVLAWWISLVWVLVGCDSDPSGASSGSVIMPLALGNEWVYEQEFYNLAGTLTSTGTTVLILTDTSFFNGMVWYYDGSRGSEYFTNKNDGLHFYHCQWNGCTDKLTAPYPAPVGFSIAFDTTFSTYFDQWDQPHEDTTVSTLTLVSQDTLVTVPAGSFHCYKYRMDYRNLRRTETGGRDILCYAVDLGKIYSESSYLDNRGAWILRQRSLLTSMKLR